MSPVYIGIDVADTAANRARVTVEDDGSTLSVIGIQQGYGEPLEPDEEAALDSPLGYPRSFLQLVCALHHDPSAPAQVFKYRRSEDAVADHVAGLQLAVEANALVPHFFNRGRHVQSTIGLEIVPGALRELIRLLGVVDAAEADRGTSVRAARLGIGRVVEAHPRLFMYSALSRIREELGQPLPIDLLTAARDYKTPARADEEIAAARVANRELVLGYLIEHSTAWLGVERTVQAEGICARDHDFDAFLCALTAHANAHLQTLPMGAYPGLEEISVSVEGHILILGPLGQGVRFQ